MYSIYWLVDETKTRTYVGFSDDLFRRLSEHKNGKVKTTKNFGAFQYKILEEVQTENEARQKELYWKSCAGRKKLKKLFHAAIV